MQDEHTNVQKQEKIPERTLSRNNTPEQVFKLLTLFIMTIELKEGTKVKDIIGQIEVKGIHNTSNVADLLQHIIDCGGQPDKILLDFDDFSFKLIVIYPHCVIVRHHGGDFLHSFSLDY